MKYFFTTSVVLFSLVALAQPGDNPRIKPFLDKFNKSMEEIRKVEASGQENKTVACKIHADNAMTAIGHIKKRDPNYDVASLEAMVKPYIDAQSAAVEARNNSIKASGFHAGTSPYSCYSLFSANLTTEFRPTGGNLDEDIKNHIALLKTYEERVEVLLRDHKDGVETCLPHLRNSTDAARERIAKYKKVIETEEIQSVKSAYRELVGEQTYWNAARRIYPAFTDAATVYQQATDGLTAVGNMEQVMAKANERKKEKMKNTFMPKAVVTNAALEAEFKEAFANEGWGETIVKINLLSRDWTILRNSITGVITGRIQTAAIVAKQKTGNCILYDYTIQQAYTGSGYSSTSRRHAHGVLAAEFLCENVSK